MKKITNTPLTEGLKQAAINVVKAKAYFQTVEPVVTKYQTAWLKKNAVICPTWEQRGISSPDMSKPSNAYLLPDGPAKEYYEYCDAEAAKAGFEVEKGYCPKLIAENQILTFERLLLKQLEADTEVDFQGVVLLPDDRRKAVDLAMKYVLNHPLYK